VSQPGLTLTGTVLPLPGLAEVQGAAFNVPTIVLAQVGGSFFPWGIANVFKPPAAVCSVWAGQTFVPTPQSLWVAWSPPIEHPLLIHKP
jgi:hypothetical protein